jgi:hypothetical protein
MSSWFTESAIGLDITSKYAIAVYLTTSGQLSGDGYIIRKINHKPRSPGQSDETLIHNVLDGLPEGIPVIPVVYPATTGLIQPESTSSDQDSNIPDWVTPILNAKCDFWNDSDNGFITDTGHTRDVIRILNQSGTINAGCPGAVSVVRSISSLVSLSGCSDTLVVIPNPPAYTLVAFVRGSTDLRRTVYCQPETLRVYVKTIIQDVTRRHSEWMASIIAVFGDCPDKNISEHLSRLTMSAFRIPDRIMPFDKRYPAFTRLSNEHGSMDESGSKTGSADWLPAAGAAISWIRHGKHALLTQTQDTGAVKVIHRSSLLLQAAILVFLLSVSAGLAPLLMQEKNTRDSIRQQIETETVIPDIRSLPAIPHLPASPGQVRNHRHLSAIARYTQTHELVINDVRVTMDRIVVRGFGDNIASINAFNNALLNHFADSGAVVASPITTRDASGRLAFRQEIVWGRAS